MDKDIIKVYEIYNQFVMELHWLKRHKKRNINIDDREYKGYTF